MINQIKQNNSPAAVKVTPLSKGIDWFVYATIIALAVMQFVYYERSGDFFRDDILNWELAKSILNGSYQFNGKPETLYPPVFPLLLLLVSKIFGATHAVLVRSMAVFGAIGLIAAYNLLKHEGGRYLAAAGCLLVGTSSALFALNTRWVVADLPFLALVMIALLLAVLAGEAKNNTRRWVMTGLLAFSIVAALLVRSAAVTFILAMVLWLGASLIRNRAAFKLRWRIIAPALLLGILTQGIWSQWAKRETPEWWVGDFPGRSYFFQVQLKVGAQPELGFAKLTDLPARAENNLRDRLAGMSEIFLHRYVTPAWSSIFITALLLLVAAGWISSVLPRGGELYDWFFASHELMYLVWPWPLESRFLLPVAPLVLLYVYRGAIVLWKIARLRPVLTCIIGTPLSAILAAAALSGSPSKEMMLSGLLWAFLAGSLVILAFGQRFLARPLPSFAMPALKIAGCGVLALLVVAGVAQQVELGRRNLQFDPARTGFLPDIEAARWIRSTSPPSAVVMARQLPVVYYHSGYRKTVWFPPITDAQILMDGIRNYGVQYVLIVNGRADSYFLPPEEDCFARLLTAHPEKFRLVHDGEGSRVYEVVAAGPSA